MTDNRLYRSEDDRILGGVCGGIAEVYDLDPSLVRITTLLIVLFTGVGVLPYIAAWLIIPTESELKKREDDSEQQAESAEESEEETGEENKSEELECDECDRSFDSQRGLSIHQSQKH